MRTDLICEAIDMAARRCPYTTGETIFHSDRGCQYTSEQLARHLESYGIRPSVGRTGVCWDNAWAESFNATLKNERAHANGVPHETQGHQRYCLPGSSLVYKSDASSLGARVPDAGRGRTRSGKQQQSRPTNTINHSPRHTQQPTTGCLVRHAPLRTLPLAP